MLENARHLHELTRLAEGAYHDGEWSRLESWLDEIGTLLGLGYAIASDDALVYGFLRTMHCRHTESSHASAV